MKTLVYVCPICGNVIMKVVDSGVVPVCCGEEMELLQPQMAEHSGELHEKHIPVVRKVDDHTLHVAVGSVPHPMSADHQISFILLELENGLQLRFLQPGDSPDACFCSCEDKPENVYALCNKHGLWGLHLAAARERE